MTISGTECCNSCNNDSIIKMNPDKKKELEDYMGGLSLGEDADKPHRIRYRPLMG